MTGAEPIAEVTRGTDAGPAVESVHHGHVVVVGPDGVLHAVGAAGVVVFPRSAVKPLQVTAALELVDDPEGIAADEVAVAWASHRGEPRHLAAVRRLLARSGTTEEQLTTPPGRPEALTAWPPDGHPGPPTRLGYNCSGKHAMFALAGAALGVRGPSVIDPDGPVQRAVLALLDETLGGLHGVGVDGCGAPAVRCSLAGLARATAGVASQQRFEQVRRAGLQHPGMVGGEGRLETALLAEGVVAKPGAEGVFVAGWTDGRGGVWGLAAKASDGDQRGVTAAVRDLLVGLGVVGSHVPRPAPPLGGGEPVGEVRAAPAVLELVSRLGV